MSHESERKVKKEQLKNVQNLGRVIYSHTGDLMIQQVLEIWISRVLDLATEK